MYLGKLIPLVFLIAGAICIDQFKTPNDQISCIHTCHVPITQCLKITESACSQSYIKCHESANFITCIESSNGLFTQQIAKCMKRDCKPAPKAQENMDRFEGEEMGMEFRKFKNVFVDDGSAYIQQEKKLSQFEGKQNQQNLPKKLKSENVKKEQGRQ